MPMISLRVTDDELSLIKSYTSANGLNVSAFARDAVLDRIEDDFDMDEERILGALKTAEEGPKYEMADVWRILGV